MSDPYVGEIRMFGGNYAPAAWAWCNGALLPISEYDQLFNLIGTTYGGDGETTFALPDLRARIPMHQGNGFVMGQIGGVEVVALTAQQMPVHSHPFNATTALATQPTPGGNVPAQSGTVQLWTEDNANAPLAPNALAPAGGNQPHDNMHPYVVLNFIISLFGTFPSPT